MHFAFLALVALMAQKQMQLVQSAKMGFQKMNEYRYILDKSSKKFVCPDCNEKRLVRYMSLV